MASSNNSVGAGIPGIIQSFRASMEPIDPNRPQINTMSASQNSNNVQNEHLRRIQMSMGQQSQGIQGVQSQVIQYNNQGMENIPTLQRAELKGRVTKIDPKNRKIFWVYTEKMNRTFKCCVDFFCPIKEGDALCGLVEFSNINDRDLILNFVRPPLVEIGMDKDSVTRTFIKILRGTGFGSTKAEGLYKRFLELAEEKEQRILQQSSPINIPSNGTNKESAVCHFISDLAEEWYRHADEATVLPLTSVINMDQGKKLLMYWYKQCNMRRLYLLGLNNKEIKACHTSCDDIYQKCLKDPFTVYQISMEKCYSIWTRIGRTYTKEQERCGLIARKIYEHSEIKSWTGTPSRLITGLFPDIGNRMVELQRDYNIVGNMFTVYLPYQYKVEVTVAEKIANWIKENDSPDRLNSDANFLKPTLDPQQKKAIQGALDNSISIITGLAGGGKTTAIAEIIHNLELREIPYVVASFTGKAVARIREVIKRKTPATLHRLINMASSVPKFKYVIIDEASMVTTELFYEFGKTFEWDFNLVFVGDPNQLQPIGWGNLFSQMISSGKVPVYKLLTNHRSDTTGVNGIRINSTGLIQYKEQMIEMSESDPGMYIEPFNFTPAMNFSMLDGTIENVFDIVRAMHTRGVESSKLTIITPYNKNLDILNTTYQEIYNDGKPQIKDCKGKFWMVGDRVMMCENNYDINVMNGEEGIIIDIIDDGKDQDEPKIVVVFEDGAQHKFNTIYTDVDPEEDVYTKKELSVKQLQHSFAVTVHKSQGSEWDFVIIYIPHNGGVVTSFLNSNLVYTAITRARRAVWMIGDVVTFNGAAVIEPPYRCDNLSDRVRQLCHIES